MLTYLAKRLGLILPTVFGITLVAFGFIRILPGDPVLLMAGERGLSEERYSELLSQFGYDLPLWKQYWRLSCRSRQRRLRHPRSSPRSRCCKSS